MAFNLAHRPELAVCSVDSRRPRRSHKILRVGIKSGVLAQV